MSDRAITIIEPTPAERALLTTALNLFVAHHETEISVKKLLSASGVTRAGFYKMFAGMDDVYAGILCVDELTLTPLLRQLRAHGDVPSLMSQYLAFRIQHIERYKVLIRLEDKLHRGESTLERFSMWQALRRQHVDEFTAIVQSKLPPEKQLDKENIRFYYGLVWSIAAGYGQLSDSDFFHDLIIDRRGFTRFLVESTSLVGQ